MPGWEGSLMVKDLGVSLAGARAIASTAPGLAWPGSHNTPDPTHQVLKGVQHKSTPDPRAVTHKYLFRTCQAVG